MAIYGSKNVQQEGSVVPSALTMQSGATANGNGTVLDVAGYATATLVVTGSFIGTVNFEASVDGTNYFAIAGVSALNGTLAIGNFLTTSIGTWLFNVAGYRLVRARISGWVSGAGVTVQGYVSVISSQIIRSEQVLGASTTGLGSIGSVIQGVVGASAPTYSDSTFNALSLSTAGLLRVDGSGATQPVSGTVAISNSFALESGGNLATIAGGLVAQASTTSGQKGHLIQGAVTTSAPSYSNGQTSPLSLTTGGLLRVDAGTNLTIDLNKVAGTTTATGNGTASAGCQRVTIASDNSNVPISGTVTANAGTNLNTSALALESGGNLAALAGGLIAQASTTSGQKGHLIQGAVTTSAPSYTNAQSSPLSLTTSGLLRVDGSGATQPVSGTITANAGTNLNTSALALESGGNLATIAAGVVAQASTTSGQKGHLIQGAVTTSAPSYTNAQTSPLSLTTGGLLRVDGSGATQPVSGTVTANAGTNLNTSALALESGGNLAALVAGLIAQASTTSGQKGHLIQGAVTTSAPSYTTLQTSPLSLTTGGLLRVDGSGATQPVSGTVTANAGTNLNTSALALESGGNLATIAGGVVAQASTTSGQKGHLIQGAVTTSAPTYTTGQTSPFSLTTAGAVRVDAGTVTIASNSSVNVGQIAGTTTATGNGTASAGCQRVTIASDNSAVPTSEKTYSTSSVTSVTAATSSTSILASNSSRRAAAFYNDSTATCYLKLGATASTTSFTVKLKPDGYYELPQPVYTGAIDAIWSAANGALRVTEIS